jgi:hypothetical protein
MGLGLPLIQILTVPQFRAVLAHEFGHYYGGDTRLGPWVYTTRAAMVRTLQRMAEPSALLEIFTRVALARLAYGLVMFGLGAYWKLFMRVTQVVSRRQEYRADELACRMSGAAALIEGLRRIEGASSAFPFFWQSELAPALQAGYLPPIAQGFGRFLATPDITRAVSKHLEAQLKDGSTNPYDTHPALRDRIAAARLLDAGSEEENPASAITLLDNVNQMERALLRTLNLQVDTYRLKNVAWEEIGAVHYLPSWKSFVKAYVTLLSGMTVETLPDALPRLRDMGSRIADPKGRLFTPDERTERAAGLLWVSLALALIRSGWELHAEPGEFHLRHGDRKLSPAQIGDELRSGNLTPDAWREQCREAGIGGLQLSEIESDQASA